MRQFVLFSILLLASHAAFALQCGDTVTGTVTLTDNLTCVNQTALTVDADSTNINLNGFTITCVGSGLLGSCQGLPGSSFSGPFAIASNGFNHVTVTGPGTIAGFMVGVGLIGGSGHSISGLTITGPFASGANQRGQAAGVYLKQMPCVSTNPLEPYAASAVVSGNNIGQQVSGILMVEASCIQVYGNTLTYNNAAIGNSHGIALAGGSHSSIYSNTVYGTGNDQPFDSGIAISFTVDNNVIQPSDHIIVYKNQVSNNCGDGIVVTNNSTSNNIQSNTARFNGDTAEPRICPYNTKAGMFHDLAASVSDPSNQWNPNNICRTQTLTIPAGVCNPWE